MSTETPDTQQIARFEGRADRFGSAFYPLYDAVFDETDPLVRAVEEKLAESRMPVPVEMYLSRALGVGLLVALAMGFVGLSVGVLLATTGVLAGPLLWVPLPEGSAVTNLVRALRVPFAIVAIAGVSGTLGFGLGFGALVSVPYTRSYGRRREINMLLPDAVSFMYALSVGGLNQLELLETMAKAEDTYGEVSREFQAIVRETKSLDADYRTAIRNQTDQSPSDEFRQFLVDMLSVINSGGDMTAFLEDKKHKHLRTAKQEQERALDTLELMGEMYITISLFPLLLIIVLVVMLMLGNASSLMLYVTVYGLIPVIATAFLVLVTTAKQDEFGDGYIRPSDMSEWLESESEGGVFDLGYITVFSGDYRLFDRIERKKGLQETVEMLREPHLFFKQHPLYTLAVSVPAAVTVVATAVVTGAVPTTWDGVVARPVWSTVVYWYLPLFVVVPPLALFYEWNQRSRRAILWNLSDNLLKLATVNDTGATLLESIRTVSETSSDKLAREFRIIHRKVNYGMSLKESLIEFNNEYHIPRLARTVKLITKAQEASSHISAVLSTAAAASENQDDLRRERRSRTRMQVAIVVMTYVTLLGVMAMLKTQFVDVMAAFTGETSASGVPGGSFGGDIDGDLLSLLFFHAVSIQAVFAGLIAGYLREARLQAGAKYVVALATLALGVWMVVG